MEIDYYTRNNAIVFERVPRAPGMDFTFESISDVIRQFLDASKKLNRRA